MMDTQPTSLQHPPELPVGFSPMGQQYPLTGREVDGAMACGVFPLVGPAGSMSTSEYERGKAYRIFPSGKEDRQEAERRRAWSANDEAA